MEITRRELLGFGAGAAAGYAFSRLPVVRPRSRRRSRRGPGVERLVPTTCLLCPAACGVLARVVDGRVVKLEGNPLHPVNRGRLCAVGQSGLHVLYSADRARGPMRRVGPRGSDRFERISWDAAIGEVAGKLRSLREARRREAVVVVDGHGRGLMDRLWDRVLAAAGSSLHLRDVDPDGSAVARDLSQGVGAMSGYDLEGASSVLSFGAPLFEAWWSPVLAQRAFGRPRGEGGVRPRLVVADSRFSRTAAKADEWVPIRPGGFGAFALAIAYVLVREDLYDRAFVQRYTFGFESWKDSQGTSHPGFRDYLLQNCRPDALAGVSGVPVETALRVAKDFAAHRPAVAIAGHGATLCGNGVSTALAIQALNALLGSVERPGGVLTPPPLPFPEWPEDPHAREEAPDPDPPFRFARAPFDAFADRLLSGPEGRVEVLFLHHSDPAFSTPDPDRFARALAKVSLVVDFSPFPDDTTPHADLWLPDPTFLERWQDGEGVPASGLPVFGLVQPAVPPVHDTMPTGDFLLRVAKAMGGETEQAFPWASTEEMVRQRAEALFNGQRGTTFVPAREEAQIRELERRGWWFPSQRTFEEFWEALRRSGGWWDPAYPYGEWGRVFRTPSRRYEFYSTRLRDAVERETGAEGNGGDPARRAAVLGGLGLTALGDEVYLPHLEPPRPPGSDEGRTLALVPFRALSLSCGDQANLPWLQDLKGTGTEVPWETWVEIHPDAARDFGIRDRMRVIVESAQGSIRAVARITHRVHRDVAAVLYGLGHRGGGRYARGRGDNPNRLIAARPEPLGGLRDWTSTRVRIRPEEARHG